MTTHGLTWKSPEREVRRAGPLSVSTIGVGPPVLLLHGLLGSGLFWGHAYDALADHHQLVVPDLLGFGASDRPDKGYGPDDHVAAIVEALDQLDVHGPMVVATHSLGTVLALRLAFRHPERVERVVALCPPLYPDVATARRKVSGSSPMARLFALPGPIGRLACQWVCRHRSLAAKGAKLLHRELPPEVAADSVQHTWASYSETMSRCLLTGEPATWLTNIASPVHFVAGRDDDVMDLPFLAQLAEGGRVRLDIWDGDHRLPLTFPERCIDAIREVRS